MARAALTCQWIEQSDCKRPKAKVNVREIRHLVALAATN